MSVLNRFKYVVLGASLIGLSASAHAFVNNDVSVFTKLDRKYIAISAPASQQADAKAFVSSMGDKAIEFLSNSSLSQSQKEKEFQKLLTRNFDMATIGRFALGKNWRSATTAQQKEYLKLFEDLVVRVYASRFNEYKGEGFNVASAKPSGKKDVLVTSYIVPNGGSKVQVDWRVRNKNGQNKIIDVIIEGVSMSLTQRSDFSSVIQRGGGDFEVLLAHLRK